MERNNIPNTQTLWFKDLKWIIQASSQDIATEYVEMVKAVGTSGQLTSYQGPILSASMQDFGYLVASTITCMWQAEEGSEFILSDSCFGSWEGGPGYWLHNFFIVSPRMAIVLVSKMYMEGRYLGNSPGTSMFEDSLHDFPETDYKNGPPPRGFDRATHFTPDDVFKYKRIIVPKKTVYKVNSIILDNARESLTYKCSASMLKTLRYYDKVKAELFHEFREYPKLRRKLFMELNRTHS
ncbi:hypothetical protein EMPS_10458 [Entomortierella parvispora]|uniref:Uncharacterized protein n=1 Tax=Entomortierella parvispora TaxID=205924 RepID=A0A9P3M179_9FUNG|nr:hypothetical protein EMPS_10458 [Entomortierella parvispora]